MEIATGEWIRLPDMSQGRDDHGCGMANGEIVVTAGDPRTGYEQIVLLYYNEK